MRFASILGVLFVAVVVGGCGSESTENSSTASVLAELRPGMSQAQVESALGQPEVNETVPNQTSDASYRSVTVYGYDTSDAKVAVIFHDGRVYEFRGTDRVVVSQ